MNTKHIPGTYEIRFNLSVAILLFATGALLIILYILFEEIRNILVFSTAVAGGFAAIYTGFYVSQTLKVNLNRDILHRSIEVMNRCGGLEVSKVRQFIIDNLDHAKIARSEMFSKINEDKEMLYAVRTTLNYFENVSICIQKGYVDEDVIYMDLGFMVPFFCEALHPFIEDYRIQKDDKTLYLEYEKLATCWKSGRYLYTHKKLRNLLNNGTAVS